MSHEPLEALEHRVMGCVRASARVCAAARAFWTTTDAAPLAGLAAEQAERWDELCDALSAEEEWT